MILSTLGSEHLIHERNQLKINAKETLDDIIGEWRGSFLFYPSFNYRDIVNQKILVSGKKGGKQIVEIKDVILNESQTIGLVWIEKGQDLK